MIEFKVMFFQSRYLAGLDNICQRRDCTRRIELFAKIAGINTIKCSDRVFEPGKCSFFFSILNKLYSMGKGLATAYMNEVYYLEWKKKSCLYFFS